MFDEINTLCPRKEITNTIAQFSPQSSNKSGLAYMKYVLKHPFQTSYNSKYILRNFGHILVYANVLFATLS